MGRLQGCPDLCRCGPAAAEHGSTKCSFVASAQGALASRWTETLGCRAALHNLAEWGLILLTLFPDPPGRRSPVRRGWWFAQLWILAIINWICFAPGSTPKWAGVGEEVSCPRPAQAGLRHLPALRASPAQTRHGATPCCLVRAAAAGPPCPGTHERVLRPAPDPLPPPPALPPGHPGLQHLPAAPQAADAVHPAACAPG